MKLHCTSSQISKIPTIYKKWPPQILLIFHSSFQKSFTCDRQWCWYMYIFANQYSLYMYDYMYMPWTFCTCNVKTKCMCNTTIFRQKLKKTCKKILSKVVWILEQENFVQYILRLTHTLIKIQLHKNFIFPWFQTKNAFCDKSLFRQSNAWHLIFFFKIMCTFCTFLFQSLICAQAFSMKFK